MTTEFIPPKVHVRVAGLGKNFGYMVVWYCITVTYAHTYTDPIDLSAKDGSSFEEDSPG